MTGTIAELWRYPVKSMLGEQVSSTAIGQHGVTGDRAFALIDAETGKVCSAKRHDLWGDLFRFSARLVSEDPCVAHITFPDGSQSATSDADISDRLSEALRRRVTLSAVVAEGAVLEEVWDEVKGPDMYGPATGETGGETVIDVTVSIASPGDFFDAAAIHVITRNTLEEFARREPGSDFDVRRFRPNIVVDVAETDGFVENDWKVMRSGDVEMRTLLPVPRCVMTTLPQGDLPKDRNILRSAAVHNMVDTTVVGVMPCAGLYAMVAAGGELRVGDTLTAEA